MNGYSIHGVSWKPPKHYWAPRRRTTATYLFYIWTHNDVLTKQCIHTLTCTLPGRIRQNLLSGIDIKVVESYGFKSSKCPATHQSSSIKCCQQKMGIIKPGKQIGLEHSATYQVWSRDQIWTHYLKYKIRCKGLTYKLFCTSLSNNLTHQDRYIIMLLQKYRFLSPSPSLTGQHTLQW